MIDVKRLSLVVVIASCVLLALLALVEFGKTDGPEISPGFAAAASAALRTMLGEADGKITADNPVCVGLQTSTDWVNFPTGYIDDVMARNPGLVAASDCHLYEWWIVLTGRGELLGGRGQSIPVLSCGEGLLAFSSPPTAGAIAMQCTATCGPLCGYGRGFDVVETSAGVLEAKPSGHEVRF